MSPDPFDPSDVVLDPPTLTWAKDELLQTKTVRVKLSHPEQGAVSIVSLTGGKPGFTISKGTGDGVRQFSITPDVTAIPQRALIRITAQKVDQSKRELIIYAIVLR